VPPALLVAVVVIAVIFDYTNGFHDASNAIATAIATRALTPPIALAMSAVLNVAGALCGQGVARTLGSGIISTPDGAAGLWIILAALLGAIAWNLFTWAMGLPSSSTHALIGALTGAGLAGLTSVHWTIILSKVIVPMVVSPIVGFTLAYAAMVAVLWGFRRARPGPVIRRFRIAQIGSAAAMSLGHGLQDAQKTMGVITLALVAAGRHHGSHVPLWVTLTAAAAISTGTASGGWRVMRTLGRGVVELDPPRGFVAETVAASVLYITSFGFAAPISTTHTITSAIMGVGATRRRSAVRWGVAGDIAAAWVLTLPMSALTAAAISLILRPLH
jgi:PiT family inorganic phosphate transporter